MTDVFVERPAHPALAHLVTCVWVQCTGATRYEHRTVPHGGAEVDCVVGARPRVHGPRRGPAAATLAPRTTIVGLRLRPGVAPAALGVGADELLDLDVELWEPDGDEAGDAVAEAPDPAAAARALEAALTRRLRAAAPDPLVLAATPRLLATGSVGATATALGVSERQLRRRCEAAVGQSPKRLQRILRYQRFLALAATVPGPSRQIARLAARAGYADQSHLHRDALLLDGRTPHAVLLAAEHGCAGRHDHRASHLPLLAAR